MRFGVHCIHARIARPARLQDRDTRVRSCAGISPAEARVPAAVPELIEGQVRYFAAQRSGKHGAAPSPCARYRLAPLSPAARKCTHVSSAAGSVPVTAAFEAVLHPLSPAVGVADAGAVPVTMLHLSPREAISPNVKRAISARDVLYLFFVVVRRMGKKSGAWACRPDLIPKDSAGLAFASATCMFSWPRPVLQFW